MKENLWICFSFRILKYVVPIKIIYALKFSPVVDVRRYNKEHQCLNKSEKLEHEMTFTSFCIFQRPKQKTLWGRTISILSTWTENWCRQVVQRVWSNLLMPLCQETKHRKFPHQNWGQRPLFCTQWLERNACKRQIILLCNIQYTPQIGMFLPSFCAKVEITFVFDFDKLPAIPNSPNFLAFEHHDFTTFWK